MKKEIRDTSIMPLSMFVVLLVLVTISISTWNMSENGIFRTPNGGLVTNYTAMYNETMDDPFNLSMEGEYLSRKLDIMFFMLVAGVIGLTLFCLKKLMDSFGVFNMKWDLFSKVSYIIQIVMIFSTMITLLLFITLDIDAVFLLPIFAYVFVGLIIISVIRESFFGGKK